MKWLRNILIGIGVILAGFTLAGVGLFFVGQNNLNHPEPVPVVQVEIPSDGEAIARGQYFATISACAECHGADLSGTVFVNEAPIGYLPASNLTTGIGGVGGDYTPETWARALRHGIAADGRTMTAMPTDHYAHYGDDDLGDLIAYLQQIPAVDNDLGERELMIPGTIIFGVLTHGSWPVNLINHEAVGGDAPTDGVTTEYGAYLVSITSCQSCHAENLAGNYGQLESPQGPNLTDLAPTYTEEEFKAAMRSGLTPDGRQLSPEMPWPQYAIMTESDVEALWTYLNSLDPLPNNESN